MMLPVWGTDFTKGSIRWYYLFDRISVQPVEFLKIALVIVNSWLMSAPCPRSRYHLHLGVLVSLILSGVIAGMLILQPDYGQAVLIMFTWGILFVIWGGNALLVMLFVMAMIFLLLVAYILSPHVANRFNLLIENLLDSAKQNSAPNQIDFSENAIMNGGFFGVGPGEGTVKNYLPDAHTDFIFAVGAEEYGFIFSFVIIFLYTCIGLRILWKLWFNDKMFVRITGIGLISMICVQGYGNIAVNLGLLPPKGITLPFISYGGSSLISTAIAMGVIIALLRQCNTNDYRII